MTIPELEFKVTQLKLRESALKGKRTLYEYERNDLNNLRSQIWEAEAQLRAAKRHAR
jgi:hypothetical protein